MQIEREAVESAGAGDGIGVMVPEKARKNDAVFRA